jgi:aminopeptidase YwaD
MIRSLFTILLITIFLSQYLMAQDTTYARRMIDTLTSRDYHGRGYTNEGVNKAALFLQKQFMDMGLQIVDRQRWIQEVTYPVNTFPGEMSVKIDGKDLRPGNDFIVAPESKSINGTFDLIEGDSTHFINPRSRIIVSLEDKLTWSVASQVADYTTIKVLKSVTSNVPQQIELKVEHDFVRKYKSGNLCAMVQGKQFPDSFIVFTAHYDHLGEMGKDAIFPGANDNASGISLLLGLAKYYSKNPQPYSIAFILFTGEEAGLVGSNYFVNHPLIPLQSIRFLLNLDLTGTGVEGIMVVNATEFPEEYSMLKSINEKSNLFPTVGERGKAKNSDHYWFTEKGVPSFFIYTLGGIKAYHDVYDVDATLPNDHYLQLFKLLTTFVGSLQN